MKSKSKTRSGIGGFKNNSDDWISNEHEKADELNSVFSSVFTKNENDNMPELKPDINISVVTLQ